MTKQQIFDAFNGYFSKVGIRQIDGEYRLIGKFVHIAPMEDCGLWDVWICNAADIPKGLTKHKLTAILKKLPVSWQAERLTGEAYTQVPLDSLISELTFLRHVLRIKKRQLHKGKAENLKSYQPYKLVDNS